MRRRSLPALALLLGLAAVSRAATSHDSAAEVEARLAPAGPGAIPPEAVMVRDEAGHATVRAFPVEEPLRIDGVLDEDVYSRIPPIVDLVQQDPDEGAPATERTEAWILFDEENLYVCARMWDSHPERIVANEMRRDHRNLFQNENFGFILDTFLDRRNAFFFYTTPLGGFFDGLITDERNNNRDWNTVLDVGTGRFDEGWTAELAIPFKSLRYGDSRVWGINLRRRVRWKNETTHLSHIPQGLQGTMRVSLAADLVGVVPPPRKINLEAKPYAITGLSTDLDADVPIENDWARDVGGDLKLGVTKSLTLDATFNTDFAQVEADVQQVNLTRFGLSFPEKREFFLEGQGLFAFGGVGGGPPGGFGGGGGPVPELFFSRRIGLSDDGAVPIRLGGRLTGKVGAWGIGALHIRTGQDPTTLQEHTDFSVVRVKRDVLRRSSVGVIATRRGPSIDGSSANEVYGADANFAFYEYLRLLGYWAGSRTPGLEGDETSYRVRAEYPSDRWGFELDRLKVGDAFNPEIGFLTREDFVRHYAELRFSPRPSWQAVRRLGGLGSYEHVTTGDGVLESWAGRFEAFADLDNSGRLQVTLHKRFERLFEDFEIVDGVVIPPGDYRTQDVEALVRLPQQNRISGDLTLFRGSFFGGTRTEAGYNGRVQLGARFSIEPRVSLNWVDLPFGDFTSRLIGSRFIYAFSPRAFASALLQYNSLDQTLDSNIRLRWEYVPGSELFVVYSDGRETGSSGFPGLRNRSVVVKLTRLLRF